MQAPQPLLESWLRRGLLGLILAMFKPGHSLGGIIP